MCKIKLKSSYLEEKTDFTFYEILTRVSAYFEEVDSDFNGQITFNEFITQIPTMLEIHHRSGLSRHCKHTVCCIHYSILMDRNLNFLR